MRRDIISGSIEVSSRSDIFYYIHLSVVQVDRQSRTSFAILREPLFIHRKLPYPATSQIRGEYIFRDGAHPVEDKAAHLKIFHCIFSLAAST